MSTRRGAVTSYKAKYQSSSAARLEAEASLVLYEQEKQVLRSIGTDTITKLGHSIDIINKTLGSVQGCLWFQNENGSPLVAQGTVLSHEQTLLADADNVLVGIKLLCSIIDASEKSMSDLVLIITDLQASHDQKTLLSNESILSRAPGRGLVVSSSTMFVQSPIQGQEESSPQVELSPPAVTHTTSAQGEMSTPRSASFSRPVKGKARLE